MAESLVFSGFPMSTEIRELNKQIKCQYLDLRCGDISTKSFKRGLNLAQTKSGSGHDCFLKGITVSAVIKAPQYFWQQIKRYHFFDIISSQSTMHRITQMSIADCCNDDVDQRVIEVVNEYILNGDFIKAIANLPSGFCLTGGITTNYLQLKTIYNQRRNHKLTEWSEDFMEFLKSLPYFERLVIS
jgi:hypothetical protein